MPEDDFKRDLLSSVPVWINIPAIGRAWTRKAISKVAIMGRVRWIDHKTLDPIAYGEARVFVDFDTEEEPSKEAWLEILG